MPSAMDAFREERFQRDLEIIGPRALCSWCDGKLSQRTAHEIVVATFHSIVAIGFVLAAAAGLWVLMNQDKFNSFAECPRLMYFILATTIMISVYVASNLMTVFIRDASILLIVLVFFFFVLHIAMNVFNIFGTVWLFSAPGKYYVSDTLSPLGCDSRIVNGIKIYLIAFWSYFMLLLVTMIINMCWNSYKELEDPEVAANEAKTLRNQWTLRSSRIQNY